MNGIDQAELLDKAQPAGPESMRTLCDRLTKSFLIKHTKVLLLLSGEPGAGKTTFCQGFREALGIDTVINSPTFNILNEYRGRSGDLFHYDLYRLGAGDELFELDFLERWMDRPAEVSDREGAAGNSGGNSNSSGFEIHAVEWWERARQFFPVALPTFLLKISHEADPESETRETELYRLPSL